jgi:hypothetical protein
MARRFRVPPKELRRDRDVAMLAVTQSGLALAFASKDLWCDRDVVIGAVKQSGRALAHASEDLKCDREVVLEAVKQDGRQADWARAYLCLRGPTGDRYVVLEAVK